MSGPSWQPSNNPYESPKPIPQETTHYTGGPWTMDYLGVFSMIQKNPNWIANSFIVGAVTIFIPILGQLVSLGYTYETAEVLHRTHGKTYWDFNFSRFGEYITRGGGPFLVFFLFGILLGIAGLIMQTIIGNYYEVPLGLAPMLYPHLQKPFTNEMIGPYIQAYLLSTVLQNILQGIFAFIYFPMGMNGGLAHQFSASFNIAKGLDILSRVWVEMLLYFLFSGVLMFGLSLIGFLTCLIGFIPIMGYISVLNGWFSYQLYRMYLSRGGEPIPLKPMPAFAQN